MSTFDNENIERVPISPYEMAAILFNEKREVHLMPPFYYQIVLKNKAKLLRGESLD